jgi:hypothetical protein
VRRAARTSRGDAVGAVSKGTCARALSHSSHSHCDRSDPQRPPLTATVTNTARRQRTARYSRPALSDRLSPPERERERYDTARYFPKRVYRDEAKLALGAVRRRRDWVGTTALCERRHSARCGGRVVVDELALSSGAKRWACCRCCGLMCPVRTCMCNDSRRRRSSAPPRCGSSDDAMAA